MQEHNVQPHSSTLTSLAQHLAAQGDAEGFLQIVDEMERNAKVNADSAAATDVVDPRLFHLLFHVLSARGLSREKVLEAMIARNIPWDESIYNALLREFVLADYYEACVVLVREMFRYVHPSLPLLLFSSLSSSSPPSPLPSSLSLSLTFTYSAGHLLDAESHHLLAVWLMGKEQNPNVVEMKKEIEEGNNEVIKTRITQHIKNNEMKEVIEMVEKANKDGVHLSASLRNAVVRALTKHKTQVQAPQVRDAMLVDLVQNGMEVEIETYEGLVEELIEERKTDDCLELVKEVHKEGKTLRAASYTAILRALDVQEAGEIERGYKKLLENLTETRVALDPAVLHTCLRCTMKLGDTNASVKLVRKIQKQRAKETPKMETWEEIVATNATDARDSILLAFAHAGDTQECASILRELTKIGKEDIVMRRKVLATLLSDETKNNNKKTQKKLAECDNIIAKMELDGILFLFYPI
jgi:hypothetical protein